MHSSISSSAARAATGPACGRCQPCRPPNFRDPNRARSTPRSEQSREETQVNDAPSPRPHVSYNPTAADFQQNPFPSLHQLRAHDPVHLTRQGWVVTGFEDCARVLTSRDFGMRGIEGMLRKQLGTGPAYQLIAHRFHSYDPPEHTRLRSLVAAAFTPRRVESLRAHVEALAERILDAIGSERSE